ncbi:MAG: DNA-directed RNA polymerase subunit H [Nanoarchaeota archaeon]
MAKDVKIHEHLLVPKHLLLSKEDAEKLFSHYNISQKQMPQISIKDPTITHLNPQLGDIIKIIRDSETESQAAFFRTVKKE